MPTTTPAPILLTALGSGDSNVSRLVADALLDAGHRVRVMIHTDDGRADPLRARGADVEVGDLTNPQDVATALRDVRRAFFNMAVSTDYLEAAATFCSVAREQAPLEALVNLSQMTVSQMTATSTSESRQQRQHWLAERVMDWSGLPVVHVRPTVFLDNPLFTLLPREPLARSGVLALPIGEGKTSPVAAADVGRVVASVLSDPAGHVGHVYELTGPAALDLAGLAAAYSRALHRPVRPADLPQDELTRQLAHVAGIPAHVVQHILTVAELHRANRYDRLTSTVEDLTGRAPESVEHFLAAHRALFEPG